MRERSTGITFVIFLCHIRTCNDGCKINKQMKEDLIFIYSISQISTALFTEYLTKHDSCFAYSVEAT